jgi:hypothetical protein
MNFPCQLRNVLTDDVDDHGDDEQFLVSRVRYLNESIEKVFSSVNETVGHASQDYAAAESALEQCSSLLAEKIVNSIDPSGASQLTDRIPRLIEEFRDPPLLNDSNRIALLSELLRAVKNLMRWYMQIYLAHQDPIHPHPLEPLQNRDMLGIYWALVQQVTFDRSNQSINPHQRQEMARYACLSLFYSTYSPIAASSERIQQAQKFLVESLSLFEGAIKVLSISTPSYALTLSLLRVLHNILASVQGAVGQLETIKIASDELTAPWVTVLNDKERQNVGIRQLLSGLSLSIVSSSSPAFPGTASDDRRLDVVVETLRVLYILRSGQNLDDHDSAISKVVKFFLQKDNAVDPRFKECTLQAISLLMDAPTSYADCLLNHDDATVSLLSNMERQIRYTIDNTLTGSTAATALVPILSVVHGFSKDNTDFRRLVKSWVFPLEAEEGFRELASQEIARTGSTSKLGAKNMKPLDAPKDTLRGMLIRLMTWPESHTKRSAAELLWTLCDCNTQEYVLRCGLGNAMPMLAAKGVMELPSNTLS